MSLINVLDNNTIDKIAAGEVVERPASVVKELVENAMDAGAKSITVEIKDGGIEFIRVTDDGEGIEKSQVRNAFLRHATSKIRNVSDLMSLQSMGFRGEALSSIASVSKVEVITKTKNSVTGTRMCLDGGAETGFEDVGAPDGTTFIVRNLFFNTPARRKFLKTAMTEGSYVTDLLEHLALARPEISFKYVLNGQTKFFTSGDGDLHAIIYRIFGRDIAGEMIEFQMVEEDIVLEGYIGKPVLNRANRNFENYFVNQRYIKNKMISKAIEEGYQPYLMQHRYPFCVLHITVPSQSVDVNVHPSKMEIRFSNQNSVYRLIAEGISVFLAAQEMIPAAGFGKESKETSKNTSAQKSDSKNAAPEPFEKNRILLEGMSRTGSYAQANEDSSNIGTGDFLHDNKSEYNREKTVNPQFERLNDKAGSYQEKNKAVKNDSDTFFVDDRNTKGVFNTPKDSPQLPIRNKIIGTPPKENEPATSSVIKAKDRVIVEKPEQLNFFDEKLLSREARMEYRIIGQLFDTYWIIEYRDKMLVIDQHAAHEKVKYEQLLKRVENHEIFTQQVTPPAIISVTPKEADIIRQYEEYFKELGFELEDFGMNAYAVRGVPIDLFDYPVKELFEEILTQISTAPIRGVPDIIREKIASMACKAAVKGRSCITFEEADKLIEQLLELDNPYNCPHGRPTIISMSKYEIEKKFKRII